MPVSQSNSDLKELEPMGVLLELTLGILRVVSYICERMIAYPREFKEVASVLLVQEELRGSIRGQPVNPLRSISRMILLDNTYLFYNPFNL